MFSVKVGFGLIFGISVVGEKVFGNYFELYLVMVEMDNVDVIYQFFYVVGNYNDNCVVVVIDVGVKNYVIEDIVGKVENCNGWLICYLIIWGVNMLSVVNIFGVDVNGNCFMGVFSGVFYIINCVGLIEGSVILNFQVVGVFIGYM